MSPAEIAWRARDQALHVAWSRQQVSRDQIAAAAPATSPPVDRRFSSTLPPGAGARVPAEARAAILAAAAGLMQGQWEVLGLARTDMVRPDWFHDPVTGRRSPSDRCAFHINYRVEEQTGNIKQVWEISRLQHLTLLATAWFLSRDDAYARRVDEQLRSWWRENPFLSGVHWTSGIEVGIRLISLAWIRRLLDEWPGVVALFERNDLAVRQIRWHQQYLNAFRSRGSSANNHVIAEAAGQLVASCAFPWFPESARWRQKSARLLERELARNTFPSGIGRELASDYQCFITELGLLAAIEAERSDRPLSASTWQRLCAMTDSAAALVDERLRPPRQGDDDEGRALLLDAPECGRWPLLLSLGEVIFGRLGWWPPTEPTVSGFIVGAMIGTRRGGAGRPAQRPSRFADAGMTVLRTTAEQAPEIWCRLDGGPHGFLSIAAHAHADALSVEIRYGGVDILADPGTYCYHGEPEWRSYFRSTIAHNTVELDGRNQSRDGGPFLWLSHANGRELGVADLGDIAEWKAEHDGYLSLRPPTHHRRTVQLDRASRSIAIIDQIDGGSHGLRIAFHLGPDVRAELDGTSALLSWTGATAPGSARLELPCALEWSLHLGEMDPILGWYSGGFGHRVPAITLLGEGQSVPGVPLSTRLEFNDADPAMNRSFTSSAVSWSVSDSRLREEPESHAETG
jgi:hypothetical protein